MSLQQTKYFISIVIVLSVGLAGGFFIGKGQGVKMVEKELAKVDKTFQSIVPPPMNTSYSIGGLVKSVEGDTVLLEAISLTERPKAGEEWKKEIWKIKANQETEVVESKFCPNTILPSDKGVEVLNLADFIKVGDSVSAMSWQNLIENKEHEFDLKKIEIFP